MRRVHTPVGFPGKEEHGGVFGAVLYVVEWRVGVECAELCRVFDGAEFGDVERAVGIKFDAEHVVDSDVSNDCTGESRVLCEECAHEQAAVAATFDGEFIGTRVSPSDEVFRARREIVEHVLLFREVPCEMPLFTVFATAADIGDDVDAATVEPQAMLEIKARSHADAVAAVGVKKRGIVAVELRAFAAQDVDGDFCAVLADGEFAHRFNVAEVHRRGVEKRGLFHFLRIILRGGIVDVARRGFGVAHLAEKDAIIARAVFQRENLSNARHARTVRFLRRAQIAGGTIFR